MNEMWRALSVRDEIAAAALASRDAELATRLAVARARGNAVAVSPGQSEVTGNLIDGVRQNWRWEFLEVEPGGGVPVGWEVFQ